MDTHTLLGDRYQLSEIIGTGGMSDVYAGTDTVLGRDVAVKVMRPDLARDNTFLERFRREATNAAKLNHHAIVAIYDTGQTSAADGCVPYIVMERVRGRTLRDIVHDDGPLAPEQAAAIMASVADALQFSHEAGIIHRDIKPANIMITSTGAVKVMDFGIARALGDATSSMTQTAAVIGTAQYLSPEQARGKSADARSDIYAAGCVFYELVTGRPPFQGESPFSVAYQHVQDEPVHPSQVAGVSIPQPMATYVDAVILTAMAKNPADRYENASDFASDLHRIVDHRVPLAAQAHMDDATTVMPAALGHRAAGLTGAAGAVGLAGAAAGAAAAAAGAGHGAGVADGAGVHNAAASVGPQNAEDAGGGAGVGQAGAGMGAGQAGAGGPGAGAGVAGPGAGQAGAGMGAGGPVDPAAGQPPYGGQFAQGQYTPAPEPRPSAQRQTESVEPEPRTGSSAVKKWTIAIWVTVLIAVLGVGGYVGYTVYQSSSGRNAASQQITIPDVRNMDASTAESQLEALGLKVTTVEKASADVAQGKVIDTSPSVGSQVRKDSSVTLTVSSGKEVTEVPDLTGKDTAEAAKVLQDAGLVLDQTVKEAASDTIAEGKIVEQSPSSGSRVSKGSKVTITVSTGVAKVRVPVVTGQTVDDARGNIEAAGFVVEIQNVDSAETAGKVLSVSNEGTQMPKGSTITLQVSKGNQFTMPNVAGQTYERALWTLQNAGWTGGTTKLSRHDVKTKDPSKVGTVQEQSTAAGQTLDKNATIELGVAVLG